MESEDIIEPFGDFYYHTSKEDFNNHLKFTNMEKFAFISQPMKGLTREEIEKTRKEVEQELHSKGYTILNSYFAEEFDKDIKNKHVWFLAKSLEVMSKADLVYFCKGWEEARGCKIEHEVAEKYELEIQLQK
jgi:hypothetical protein